MAQEITLKVEAEKPLTKGIRDSLQIKGNFPDFESVRKKTDTVYLTLQQMGYIDVELLELRKDTDSSYLALFNVGKKYKNIWIFYSPEDFSTRDLQTISTEITKNYFSLPLERVPLAMRKLTSLRNKKGNAFARVRLTEIEKDKNDNLTATLFLDNGGIRTIDSIAVKGYEKFPRSFLKYYAGIRKGKVFDKQKLVSQNEKLGGLGFVSAIKPPEALFRKDSTVVYFYLEKRTNNQFDGILGFATDEETQKLQFNGYLNLELNNNLNYGEQFLLNYRADGKEQIQFRTKVTLPYLFATPLGTSAELKIFKRDSSFVSTEQQFRVTYQINPTSQTYVGYRGFESSNLLDQQIAGTPIEDFKSKFIVLGATYLKTQNQTLFPIKSHLILNLGAGTRKGKGKSENQYQAEITLNNIFQLNKKNSIFVQNNTSALFSETYLTNELFRFGGINSIRGFDENSIDASMFSVLNTEYRYQFNEAIFINSITDIGYFENQTEKIKQKLYSFGLGLGLMTKPGLFRFVVANGIAEEQEFKFSNLKVHISVSSRF